MAACRKSDLFIRKLRDDYHEIKPLSHATNRQHYTAKKKESKPANPKFYDDYFYILMRNGLYGAQVEQVMSVFYGFFYGFSPAIEIIEHEKDFFVASPALHSVQTWSNSYDYLQIKDGVLVFTKNEVSKPVLGLGGLSVLSRFFGDSDANTTNIMLQEQGDIYRVIKIDNEMAFETKDEKVESDCDFEDTIKRFNCLKTDITQLKIFKREKMEMMRKIAMTDFDFIELRLRSTLTSNLRESSIHMLKRQLASNAEPDKVFLLKTIETLEHATDEDFSIEPIIKNLQSRHLQLKKDLQLVGDGCALSSMSHLRSANLADDFQTDSAADNSLKR